MLLSILIPTYNDDCGSLLRQLLEQLPEAGEIIVGDDCSTVAFHFPTDDPRVRVYRPDHNLGRAAIRNALAGEAKGEWLLFMDADASVRSSQFITDYLAASVDAPVVCGGTGNLPECPRPEARLRYDYEVKAEQRLTLSRRQQHPYAQFTTFNFLIRRSLFLSIGFDEGLKEYGHEDTIFGLELRKRGIKVLHINNKLTHLGLEDAANYLQKTETALRTLADMPEQQKQNVRVSALARCLERLHLLGFVRLLFKASRPLLRANLLGRHPSQHLFALYKLGYYALLLSSDKQRGQQ